MLLSLGPVTLIGVNEYQQAKDQIVADRYEQLSTVNMLLTERVNDYFDTVITNLFIKAGLAEAFISRLVKGYKSEKLIPAEYIQVSGGYQTVLEKYSNEFIDFLRFYDYSDVLLGDMDGNLLYTVNGYEDLGQNLFEGDLANTMFAGAVKKSMADMQPTYSDLGHYPPMGEEKVSFFILPLNDDRQRVIGFLAVQILSSNIQTIFEREHPLGSGLRSYLIGTDGAVRYGTELMKGVDLELGSDNPLARLWLEHLDLETGIYHEIEEHIDSDRHIEPRPGHDESVTDTVMHKLLDEDSDSWFGGEALYHLNYLSGMNHIRTYRNFEGEDVLGIFLPVDVSGTPMAMISEVTQVSAFAPVKSFRARVLMMASIVIFLVMIIAFIVSRQLVKPIRMINSWVNRVASGDYVEGTILKGSNEISELSSSFSRMTGQLRNVKEENEHRSWLQEGLGELNNSVRGEQTATELCQNIITFLARYLDMQMGAMYVVSDEKRIDLKGAYARASNQDTGESYELGEGLVGQAALENQVIELTDIPDSYANIEFGLGQAKPSHLIIIPLNYDENVKGVIELASLYPVAERKRAFLEHAVESIAIAINTAQSRTRITQLLEQTTAQSEELKAQQGILREVNGELEKRARILEESEEEMRAQSEELQKSNAELEEKSEQLTLQKEEIEQKNRDIKLTSKEIEQKARELEQASKYKSEFLANMSHELRTPLNSLLLLAQMLAENDEGNLSEDQIESAQVIYNGGKELLNLINDILDLSKVEAGKMPIVLEDTDLTDIRGSLDSMFKPLAESRSLEYEVSIETGTTRIILTDSQRLLQIIKNFLSNAFKFTEKGGVYVRIFPEARVGRFGTDTFVGFAVRDTGIGIPEDKQESIFESFQQADGSTSRKYGGTGLGLTISREMSSLLGGFVEVTSEEGKGTTFTLFLPDNAVCSLSSETVLADTYSSAAVTDKQPDTLVKPLESGKTATPDPEPSVSPPSFSSGRNLLLIEDDRHFTNILEQVAEKNEFEYIHADTGASGLEMAEKLQPAAIILDLGLPDMDGRDVLAKLKENDSTKDIPVHIISGRDPDQEIEKSTIGYLVKPVTVADLDRIFRKLDQIILDGVRHVLILDQDEAARTETENMLQQKGINVACANSVTDAEARLKNEQWQCLVMDIDQEDFDCIEFLSRLRGELGSDMPSIVIQTSRDLSQDEHLALKEYTDVMVRKGEMAAERIMDEVSLFLHAVERSSPEVARARELVVSAEKDLSGHKLLLVDDDLRNTFSLSRALQGLGLEVVIADNGQSALEKLENESGIELVLMDIMMPVMDGYEATRKLRTMDAFKDLPVICLTAKAMADDRGKCLQAGANDYMAKPVEMEKLIEMLKVWLLK